MNPKKHIEYLKKWIRNKVENAGASGVVLGISGGVDSAVLAHLLAEIYPENTLGIWISINSSQEAKRNALRVFEDSKIGRVILDLTDEYNLLSKKLNNTNIWKNLEEYNNNLNGVEREVVNNKISNSNIKPRLRMLTLYKYAQENNYLVIGTSNYLERYLGYFTKWGDGAADIYPIANLYKSEVYQLAKELNVNKRVINHPPSADLWDGQTDEEHMGIKYDDVEKYLCGEKISSKIKEKIDKMHDSSLHKIIDNLPIPKEKL